MRKIFVDTSAWYVAYDRRQPEHPKIVSCLKEEEIFLVSSNYVFTEFISLLLARFSKKQALGAAQLLRESQKIRWLFVDPDLEEEAWRSFQKYQDKKWSLVDCTSFVLMKKQGLEEVLTFDHHFQQMGFTVL